VDAKQLALGRRTAAAAGPAARGGASGTGRHGETDSGDARLPGRRPADGARAAPRRRADGRTAKRRLAPAAGPAPDRAHANGADKGFAAQRYNFIKN